MVLDERLYRQDKKSHKGFFCIFVLLCRDQDFINIDSKLTCINDHKSFAIILYLSIISIQCIIHNSNIL